jgi:hypothetical protein
MVGRRPGTSRVTIRGMMICAALWSAASWVLLLRWDARRTVLYQQRDITRSIMEQAKQDIFVAGHSASKIEIDRPLASYTAHWTEWLEAWEDGGGEKRYLIRAAVSGDNGQFSLQPILVETYGSPLDAPWVDRLVRAYRERGWRYKVISAPGAEYVQKREEWIAKERPIASVPPLSRPVTSGPN